jgi:hypothetical protein
MTKRVGEVVERSHFGFMSFGGRDVQIRFERDAGSGRPYVMSREGTILMEYSDWDFSSSISVERADGGGHAEALYLHPHGYAMDTKIDQLTHTMQDQDWDLAKVVTITGRRKVRVDYYFTARESGMRTVTLSLGHYRWYFQDVRRNDRGFVAKVNSLERREVEEGVKEAPRYAVSLRARTPLAKVKEPIRVGYQNAWGIVNVVTTYRVTSPPRDRRVLLGSELVSWEPIEDR